MTHLHGGFVAAASDGNPAVTPERVRAGRDADRSLHQSAAADASLAALVPRPRPRRDPPERVRRPRRRLHPSRRSSTPAPSRTRSGSPAGPTRSRWSSRTASSTRTGPSSTRGATFQEATWIAEYFGDVMLVNGKVWPFLNVEPRMYRFRILNGCNARILNLDIGGPELLADRRRGRHVGQARASEATGARPGRASRRARRLQQVRRETLVMKNHKPPKPVSTPARISSR